MKRNLEHSPTPQLEPFAGISSIIHTEQVPPPSARDTAHFFMRCIDLYGEPIPELERQIDKWIQSGELTEADLVEIRNEIAAEAATHRS